MHGRRPGARVEPQPSRVAFCRCQRQARVLQLSLAMTTQAKTSGKRAASKRATKTGAKSSRGAAAKPATRARQAPSSKPIRGASDATRRTAPKKKPTAARARAGKPMPNAGSTTLAMHQADAPLRSLASKPLNGSLLRVRKYGQRTRNAFENMWREAVPKITARAQALADKCRSLLHMAKTMSWQA
jgi:hypothetical protein